MDQDEYLDLVDEDDNVIGRKLRDEVYKEGLWNFRVIHGFIINSEGKLWIPRRTAHKRIFPSALDYSVAGHVESGETYDQTFARETQEELNIDVSKVEYRLLGHLTSKNEAVRVFQNVYEIKSDIAPHYNPDDFVGYEWLAPQEVVEKIEGGEYAKDDMVFVIKHFYLNSSV